MDKVVKIVWPILWGEVVATPVMVGGKMFVVEHRRLPPVRRTREERASAREKVSPIEQIQLRKPQGSDPALSKITPEAAERILFKLGHIAK